MPPPPKWWHTATATASVASVLAGSSFTPRMLGNGQFALQRRRDGHALRASQLEHALHVLAEELRLDGQFIRVVPVDDRERAVEDRAQLQRMVVPVRETDGPGLQQPQALALHQQYAEAHHRGAGVDAEDDAFGGKGHPGTFDRC